MALGHRMAQKEAVNQFERQQSVDLAGVVSIALQMTPHDCLDPFSFDVLPGEATRIEQNLLNIAGKRITIPHAEMKRLVPSQKETFKMKRRKRMVDAGQPLRHADVVGVFGLERELEQSARNRR